MQFKSLQFSEELAETSNSKQQFANIKGFLQRNRKSHGGFFDEC
jgi:hypothetical protein